MTLEEFKKDTKKVSEKRNHSIKNSLGIRQAFLFIQSNKWFDIGRPLKEQQFQQIVRKVNNLLARELMNGNEVKFPKEMGSLEVRKYITGVRMKDGKLQVFYPIDWDKTLQLWYEDKEAYREKTLVRCLEPEMFSVFYNRAGSDYNNKSFYQFTANRDILRVLKKNIKKGNIDAFLR